MNDSGIFDDGQLSRESSVIRMNDNKQETIPSVPGQKRKKIGGANNKKRRKYEEVHIDHNYVLTPLPHLTPDQQFKYLCGSRAEETNGDGVAESEQGLEGQISSPGLEGVEGIESKVEKLKDGESGDRQMTKREKEEFIRDTEARLRKEGKLPPKELSPAVTDKKSRGSSEEKIERAPEKPPKIRAEPGPSFHSAVLKTMPPPEQQNHDPDTSFDLPNQHQHTEAGFSYDIPQGYVKLKLGTEKINEKILDVSNKIKEEWASAQQRKRKVIKPKKMNLNKGIVKKKKGRFSMEDICVAATILYCSKRVYNYLRNNKLMNLPCIRLVYKRLERFTCPPGKSPQVMRLLQLKLKTLDEAERNVSLSFDEIYLEQKFSYCPRLRQAFKAVKVI